jgi:hypothetical protein
LLDGAEARTVLLWLWGGKLTVSNAMYFFFSLVMPHGRRDPKNINENCILTNVEKHNTKRELNSDQQDSDQKMAVVGRIRRNRSRETIWKAKLRPENASGQKLTR